MCFHSEVFCAVSVFDRLRSSAYKVTDGWTDSQTENGGFSAVIVADMRGEEVTCLMTVVVFNRKLLLLSSSHTFLWGFQTQHRN